MKREVVTKIYKCYGFFLSKSVYHALFRTSETTSKPIVRKEFIVTLAFVAFFVAIVGSKVIPEMAAKNSTSKSVIDIKQEKDENSDTPFLTIVLCYSIFSFTIIGYALLERKNQSRSIPQLQ